MTLGGRPLAQNRVEERIAAEPEVSRSSEVGGPDMKEHTWPRGGTRMAEKRIEKWERDIDQVAFDLTQALLGGHEDPRFHARRLQGLLERLLEELA